MRTFARLLLLLPLLLLAPLAPPASAREPGPVGDFIGALRKGDMDAVDRLLAKAMEPEVRAGFLDRKGAAKSGAALEKLAFRREYALGEETWRVYAVPERKEFLVFALVQEGGRPVIRTLVPIASERARAFNVEISTGAPAAYATIVRGRLTGLRFARSAVQVTAKGVQVWTIGLDEGDLAKSLLAARGEFGLYRIVERGGRPLPYVKIFGVGERAPARVDDRPILESGMIAEAVISWSPLNLPQLKLQATAEGTRHLVKFHRETAKPEETNLAVVIDGAIVERVIPSLSFKTGAFWLQGFYKAEDAEFVRALVANPPYPAAVKVTELAAE